MKESDKILLIYKVLNEREASLEDKVLYQELSNGSGSDRGLVDDINKIFKLTEDIDKVKPEIDVEASKADFFKKLEAMESVEGNGGLAKMKTNKVKPKTRKLYVRNVMSIAAVFFVLIAAIFVFDIFSGTKKYTAQEDVSLVRLEDGTKVWLEKGSKLLVSNKYDEDFRSTELIGNAYFEVHRDENKPFTVEVNDNTVEVIGTKFQINSRDEDNLEVLVFSGKVKVTNSSDEYMFLEKDKGVKLNTEDKLTPFELKDVSATTSKENYLVFNNESLDKVAQKLSRYFNVEITFDCKNMDSYKGYTSPGYGGDDINVYFEIIEKVFNVEVHQKGNDSYTINCNK